MFSHHHHHHHRQWMTPNLAAVSLLLALLVGPSLAFSTAQPLLHSSFESLHSKSSSLPTSWQSPKTVCHWSHQSQQRQSAFSTTTSLLQTPVINDNGVHDVDTDADLSKENNVSPMSSRILHLLSTLRAGAQSPPSSLSTDTSIKPSNPSTTPVKEGFLKRHPFTSAVLITTCNAVAADLMAQLLFVPPSTLATVSSRLELWNPQRSLLFASFGFLYQGCAQYAIVNWGWERLFPGTRPMAVLAKICAMNLLSDPLLFMPTFYIFQEFLASAAAAAASTNTQWGTLIRTALSSYKANALVDWRNSWMVWFPGHAVTYGVMPPHRRIPWMAFLSFFYMCILSVTRGGGV